jgi:uncharacterized protein (DUF2141 family)
MHRRFAILPLLLALCTTVSAAPQADEQGSDPPKGLIAGTIMRQDTKTPLGDVSVSLHKTDNSSGDAVVFTEPDGKFSFSGLSPGSYSLTATRPRFTMLSDNLQKAGAWFTLRSDQQIKDIVLTLVPGGVVSGKVFDDSGEPLTGSTVVLVRPKYIRSHTRFTIADSAIVNDLGEFRIFSIPPGRYYLVAMPAGSGEHWDRERAAREARPTNYRRIFYDGALSEHDARPLQINPGTEISVSFQLPRVAIATVRLTLSLPTSFAEFSGYAGMIPVDSVMENTLVASSISNESLSALFKGIIPGRYYVGAIIDLPSEGKKERGVLSVQEFDIAEGMNEIQVPVTHVLVQLPGHLSFDSDTHPAADSFQIYTFPLRGDLAVFDDDDDGQPQNVDPSGDFTLPTLTRVRTAFQLGSKSADDHYYLKSVLVGGREALTTGVRVGEAGARIEFLAASDGGSITGAVVDASGHPVHNSTVVALPDAAHRMTYSCISSDSTNSAGHFALTGICPGQYTILALPLDAPSGIYWDPGFVDSHLQFGQPVEVKPNSHQEIGLSPIKLD